MTLLEAVEDIKLNGSDRYLSIIDHINSNNLDIGDINTFLRGLTESQVKELKPIEILLLLTQCFKGGYRAYPYGPQGFLVPPLQVAKSRLGSKYKITEKYLANTLSGLSKEDLKYVSLYHQSKWKKVNTTTTNRTLKGATYTFAIDEFSLNVFKSTIDEKFSAVVSKRLIKSVNIAYKKSSRNLQALSIRNKFYGHILENTESHTKALLNEMEPMDIEGYTPSPDEALSLHINLSLTAYTPYAVTDTYSSDTALVTHATRELDDREAHRVAACASMLLTRYSESSNEVFKTLAIRMLKTLPDKIRNNLTHRANAMQNFYNILKDTHEYNYN